MEGVSTVVCAEPEKQAKRTSGNRRAGWSAQYGVVIADVRDLLAAVDAARSATPELLAKLMQRVQRLNSALGLTVDCTGMSTEKMTKTVRQAAKHFLSSIHGRERTQMRRGTAKLRKAGAAVVAVIEAQMQQRTKNEIYKHQRTMEQVRLIAGRMRRYNLTLRSCGMKLWASLPISPPLYQLLMPQVITGGECGWQSGD